MKRRLDKTEMNNWVASVGGTVAAAKLVEKKLECCDSKAQKIVGCRYPSVPPPLEQIALASLLGRPRDVLFPTVAKPRAKAS